MATFNGARFISEQLRSLASQRLLPIELVVCDDGSTDETLAIVEGFAADAPFPVRVYRNPVNLGFAENFLQAARLCEGDWIAFCDQDDVWLPNRLQDVAFGLEKAPQVSLVLQNAFIGDENLSHEGRLFPAAIAPGLYRPGARYGFWVWPGFLQTFRASLLHELSTDGLPRNYYSGHGKLTHDKWTCLIANATGGFLVLPEPAALYRRHSAAVTGSYAAQGWKQRVGKALPVGAERYRFLAEVADDVARYLRRIALSARPELSAALNRSAEGFDRMAQIQHQRAELYSTPSILRRLRCLARIMALGGYVGPPFTALGWKSAMKDGLHACGLLRLPSGKR